VLVLALPPLHLTVLSEYIASFVRDDVACNYYYMTSLETAYVEWR